MTGEILPARTFIYALVCPDSGSIRYIGKSDDPARRLQGHVSVETRRADESHKAHWIRKLQREGKRPTVRVIFRVHDEMRWQVAERFFISAARSFGLPLTNRTEGGDGLSFINEVDRDRWRERLTEARIELWRDETYRARTIELSKAGLARPEVRAKVSANRIAHRNAPDAVAKQSDDTKAAWRDPESRAKRIAGIKAAWARPEVIAKRSESLRKTLATPQARAIKAAASKAMWAKRKAANAAARINDITGESKMMVRMPAANGANDKVAQLRVKQPARGRGQIVTSYGTTGTIFFETRERAEVLLRENPQAFELLNGAPPMPVFKQRPQVGPTETKADEKKTQQSSAESKAGPSTDSALSTAPGSDAESSSSAADRVSTRDSGKPSKPRGRPAGKKHA